MNGNDRIGVTSSPGRNEANSSDHAREAEIRVSGLSLPALPSEQDFSSCSVSPGQFAGPLASRQHGRGEQCEQHGGEGKGCAFVQVLVLSCTYFI